VGLIISGGRGEGGAYNLIGQRKSVSKHATYSIADQKTILVNSFSLGSRTSRA